MASFKKLPSPLYRFKEADANTYSRLESLNGQFHRPFFAPGPCHRVCSYSRCFMALDRTFWKSTFDMTLLVAVVLDGNNEIIHQLRSLLRPPSPRIIGIFFCVTSRKSFLR